MVKRRKAIVKWAISTTALVLFCSDARARVLKASLTSVKSNERARVLVWPSDHRDTDTNLRYSLQMLMAPSLDASSAIMESWLTATSPTRGLLSKRKR